MEMAKYDVKATPVTVETAQLEHDVDPNAQMPGLPLTQKQGRVNAVVRPGRSLLFETTEAFTVHP